MKLWTVWADYYATGEGRTLLSWVGYAEDRTNALGCFAKQFDDFFLGVADAAEGVVNNLVTGQLFAPEAFDRVWKMQGRASVELIGRLHFNFA